MKPNTQLLMPVEVPVHEVPRCVHVIPVDGVEVQCDRPDDWRRPVHGAWHRAVHGGRLYVWRETPEGTVVRWPPARVAPESGR